MLRAVLFDLDGTLIDSTEAIVQSTWHVFDTLGVPRPPRERLIETIGWPLRESFERLGLGDTARVAAVYRPHYAATAPGRTFLLPGVADALEAFARAGLRMGVVTSKRREAAIQLLEHLGVWRHFALCIGPDEVARAKPDPEGLLRALAELGVARDEAVYVGDMDFDVRAAQAAGLRCVAVASGYWTRAQLAALEPDVLVDTMDEVRAALLDAAS